MGRRGKRWVWARTLLREVLCDACTDRAVMVESIPLEYRDGYQIRQLERKRWRVSARPKRLNQRQIYAEFSMPHRFGRDDDE